MQPPLKTAVIHFLANEFKLEPESIGPDLQFSELGLNQQEISDLLQRMQDSLDFILPEDKVSDITNIEELLFLIDPEQDLDE